MPKKDLDDSWGALGDILREVSWPIKICFCVGIILGILGGLYFATFFETGRLSFWRYAACYLIGSTLLGGFLGLVVGVGVDFLLARIFPRDDDPPAGKRR
jgi:hypothetical protein